MLFLPELKGMTEKQFIEEKLTCGHDTIPYKQGNKAGISFGTILSSKSAETRAKHLKDP